MAMASIPVEDDDFLNDPNIVETFSNDEFSLFGK